MLLNYVIKNLNILYKNSGVTNNGAMKLDLVATKLKKSTTSNNYNNKN